MQSKNRRAGHHPARGSATERK